MVTFITKKLSRQTLDNVEFDPLSGSASRSLLEDGSKAIDEQLHSSLLIQHETNWNQITDAKQMSCCHDSTSESCQFCSSQFQVVPPPPRKRHCRFTTTEDVSSTGTTAGRTCKTIHHQGVLRPIAIRPHAQGSRLRKNNASPVITQRSKSNFSGQPSQSFGQLSFPNLTGFGNFCLSTPKSSSPVPRPASATDGFVGAPFMHSATTTSFSIADGICNQLCTFSTDGICNQLCTFSTDGICNQLSTFSIHSLSSEDGISDSDGAARIHKHRTSTGSMPAICCKSRSSPSSPSSARPQRCRSQPTVLQDRRSAQKRRHVDERPTLDFLKMKETAYDNQHEPLPVVALRNRSNRVQFADGFTGSTVYTESSETFRSLFSLDTIASSPLETPLDSTSSNSATLEQLEVNSTVSSPGEDGIYKGDPKRPASDSGCSGDRSEMASFLDSENSCDEMKHFPNGSLCAGDDDDDDEEEVFDDHFSNELDIDQIEKD